MLNMYLSYDPAIPLLSVHPSKMKSIYLHRDLHLYHLLYSKIKNTKLYKTKKQTEVCTRMFTAALFLIVPNERHCKCTSTDYD